MTAVDRVEGVNAPAPPRTADASPSITRRPMIDGIRGLMMALILGYHLGGFYQAKGAWLALDIFFLQSGFLITTLLVIEFGRSERLDMWRFYARRVRRLAPAMIATLALTCIAAWLVGSGVSNTLRGDGISTIFYFSNWHFITSNQSYFSSFQPSLLRQTWSLSLEEQFYIVWPWVFWLLARLTRFNRKVMAGFCLCVALALAAWMRHLVGVAPLYRAYYGTDTRGQTVMLGCGLALVVFGHRFTSERSKRVLSWLGMASIAVFGVVLFTVGEQQTSFYRGGGFIFVGLVACVMMVASMWVDSGPMKVLFANRPIAHLGRLSYPLYLVHWPLFVIFSAQRTGWTPWVVNVVRIVLSVAIAEAIHWGLEKPIQARKWPTRHRVLTWLSAVGATSALVVAVTIGVATPAPASNNAAGVTSGAKSGKRVLVLGDSMAWVLGGTAPDSYPYRVGSVFRAHCDVIGDTIFTGDSVEHADSHCDDWPRRWADAVSAKVSPLHARPDVILVSLGMRQLFDLDLHGRRVVVGSPEWHRDYQAAIERAANIITSRTSAPVFWFDVPCFDWVQQGTGGEEHDASRIATVNQALANVLHRYPTIHIIPYAQRVCEGPGGTKMIPGVRPDGAHLSLSAAQSFWRWMRPRFQAAMR